MLILGTNSYFLKIQIIILRDTKMNSPSWFLVLQISYVLGCMHTEWLRLNFTGWFSKVFKLYNQKHFSFLILKQLKAQGPG